MKFIGFLSLLLALCSPVLHAEITDTVIVLKEVEARGVRFGKYTLGAKVFTIDSATLVSFSSSSVAELLAMRSIASVNSYGPEGVAGVSLRGGSSRHTAIIWNGFNLRNPASGMMNFSLQPAGFADEISIQTGGASTMYGSGASTGAIFFSDKLKFGKEQIKLLVNPEIGSFGKRSILSSVSYISPWFSSRVKVSYQTAENDFVFKNTEKSGKPFDTLEHGAFNRFSLSQQNALMVGKISRLESNISFSKLDKQIPSLMSDALVGNANQTDKNVKGALNFSSYGSNWSMVLKSGYFLDIVDYFKPVVMQENSLTISQSVINEGEFKLQFAGNQNINFGLNNTNEFVNSKGYYTDTSRTRNSAFGRITINPMPGILYLSVEGRQEFLNSSAIPFVYSFSGNAEITKGLFLKSVISKHYSLPVFDDLFWGEDAFAKGNPGLKPEYGYNIEGGIKQILGNYAFLSENEITVYRNSIYDLIKWLPEESSGKYTPTNIRHSITRGIEFTGKVCRNWETAALEISYLYAFTDARNFDSTDNSGFYQGFYITKHKANASFRLRIYNFQLAYLQVFNGNRPINKIDSLDWYTLGNLQLNYNYVYKSTRFSIIFKINNLFNTSYQVMKSYAQPLRNYSLGINISI